MLNRVYKEAIAEVLDILEHTREEDVEKIAPAFIEYLKTNVSTTYKPNLDHTKRIKNMKLRKETLGILAIINKKYWCNN